ncbi:MAG: hypothetical protein IH899_02095 [Planctomycetes bacterium]|nr:hypothetical protein [Planctomycetota bacterium]
MQRLRGILTYSLMMTAAILFAGCTTDEPEYKKPAPSSDPIEEVHGTHKPGPHGGQLLDLGEHEYMAEVVFKEDDPKSITVYLIEHDDNSKAVVSGDEKLTINGLKVDGQETSLTLSAKPQEGDAIGKTSRFEVSGDDIPEGIEDMHELEDGTFSVMIDGKSYSSTIEHDHDDDHDHEHETDDDKNHHDHDKDDDHQGEKKQ